MPRSHETANTAPVKRRARQHAVLSVIGFGEGSGMKLSLSTGAVAALLVSAAGLGGCISTSTYGTGQAPEAAIFQEITGGLGGRRAEKIDYQPRAPLVLPPSSGQLPPPAESAAAANPQWPDDPDKRKANDEERFAEGSEDAVTPEYARRLRPLAGMGPAQQAEAPKLHDRHDPTDVLRNKNQGETFKAALAEQQGLGSAGERRYLTQPPVAYREPAATAPAEFEDIDTEKKPGFFKRLFGG